MHAFTRRCGGGALAVLMAWLAVSTPTRADDLTTLSGVTYHQVRMIRVEPDGVIWEHATGQCKVDFTDLPEAVRRTYHYDAAKAEAFQAAQARARRQLADQQQQDLQAAEARRARYASAPLAAGTDNGSETFAFHRHAAEAAAGQAIGEQAAARKLRQETLTKDDGTFWDRRLWAVPVMILGSSNVDISEHPLVDPATQEARGDIHHAPGGFTADSAHDNFFRPDYMTRAYNLDVERAEAFARGRP